MGGSCWLVEGQSRHRLRGVFGEKCQYSDHLKSTWPRSGPELHPLDSTADKEGTGQQRCVFVPMWRWVISRLADWPITRICYNSISRLSVTFNQSRNLFLQIVSRYQLAEMTTSSSSPPPPPNARLHTIYSCLPYSSSSSPSPFSRTILRIA